MSLVINFHFHFLFDSSEVSPRTPNFPKCFANLLYKYINPNTVTKIPPKANIHIYKETFAQNLRYFQDFPHRVYMV